MIILTSINVAIIAYAVSLFGIVVSSYFAADSSSKLNYKYSIPFIIYIVLFLTINVLSVKIISQLICK